MKNFIKRLIPKAYIKYFRIIFTKILDIKGNIYKFYNQLLLPEDVKRKIKLGSTTQNKPLFWRRKNRWLHKC